MKAPAALHYRVGYKSGVSQALLRYLDMFRAHMSIEGTLALNCHDCHAYSMRGSIEQYESVLRSSFKDINVRDNCSEHCFFRLSRGSQIDRRQMIPTEHVINALVEKRNM